jgi:hypothetical protein
MIELPYKLAIELVDTDVYRNHKGNVQIILHADKVMYEAICTCDFYDSDDFLKPPLTEHPYYLRQTFKKEYCSGVTTQSCYYEEIKKTIYVVEISVVGVGDDVRIPFTERKEAYSLYKTINEWIFEN